MNRKLLAELIGTAWLVLGGCGSAVIAAGVPNVGIGLLGVAIAFGLTVLTGAYAFGPISGGHFNPAVTLGLAASGRFPIGSVLPYMIAQFLGGILGAGILYIVASGTAGFDLAAGFASNGFAEHSPGGYSMLACFTIETVLTAMFVAVIICATSVKNNEALAPVAIGLCLTLIHLISIPVTNTSVNPARSTAVAVFAGGWAISQLWMFWVVPFIGSFIGAIIGRTLVVSEAKIISTGATGDRYVVQTAANT